MVSDNHALPGIGESLAYTSSVAKGLAIGLPLAYPWCTFGISMAYPWRIHGIPFKVRIHGVPLAYL